MSQLYHENEKGQPVVRSGSVKRARERAKAGLPRNPLPPGRQKEMMDDAPPADLWAPPPRRPMAAAPSSPGNSRIPRPIVPIAPDPRSANIGQAISRPRQAPQWPLPGPSVEPEPYRPPPGRPQQAPQRPPRPSQALPMLDQSRYQGPTPVILTPKSIPEDDYVSSQDYSSSVPQTPSSRMTTSSVGSIPDFPVPAAPPPLPVAPPPVSNHHPRRSANLGPPPSSRRGASSFYSNASFVSPIPEETTRSHGSYSSSAAMPDSWPGGSGEVSPTFYEDTDTEKSRDSSVYDDFGDESKLVRSASIGKRGKPALVNTKPSSNTESSQRPAPSPVQPFPGGTGYVETSTNSSNTLPMLRPQANVSRDRLTADAVLGAYAAASATDMTDTSRLASPSPQPFSHLSAIRRPPKLDIDAVRDMEARGSTTSLSDLIRRATKLAAMMDRGKRPASRFENFNDYLDEKSDPRGRGQDISGLSDMLAAFPPPGQPQGDTQSRGSWFRTGSWPLVPGQRDGANSRSTRRGMTPSDEPQAKPRRRCCGLPVWAFVVVLLLMICIIVAAVVVPLEFFVLKNWGNHNKSSESDLSRCQSTLTCQNGGTNVISQGVCSCICTNGFTGSDCSAGGSDGCTTTDLASLDGTISNVTLGKAIPRLIEGGNTNFSIPLSGTAILAKLNTGDLSCRAQNSLVTFDGHSIRIGSASSPVESKEEKLEVAGDKREAITSVSVITVSQGEAEATLVVDVGTPSAIVPTDGGASQTAEPTATRTGGSGDEPSITAAPTAKPSNDFIVTEEVLDFARVAVLYILQEENIESAGTAQSKLQAFFTNADSKDGVTKTQATSVQIGGDNSINFIAYTMNIGKGAIGGKVVKRDLKAMVDSERRLVQHGGRHGGAVILNR